MFKTKRDVDRHVRMALSKLKSEKEKNLRGFTIAKLYYKIGEFATAQDYLYGYLSVKEDCALAHKLLGQCYVQLKKPDKALISFQRSLQLDLKQHDLLIEVCKLLLADDTINPNTAKYWCDLAESEILQDDAVFNLRLKLLENDNMESNQVEEIILKEIASRPSDVNLRIRLLRHYIDKNRFFDGFKYAFDLQTKNSDLVSNSPEWYSVVGLTLNKYKQLENSKGNWDFWLLLITCLEKQVVVSFSVVKNQMTNSSTVEIANLLFNFDQCLYEASQVVPSLCAESELVELFLRHFTGQFCLYAAAILFQREIANNRNQWRTATENALPLLFLAYQYGIPDIQELWSKHCNGQTKELVQLWNKEAAFRCAQAGRCILSCIEDIDKTSVSSQVQQVLKEDNQWTNADELLAQVRQQCADNSWRNKIFRVLFPNSDHINKMQSSLFVKCPQLTEPNYELPTYVDIESYEEISQFLRPQCLRHMVYLCLGVEDLSNVRCKFFNNLKLSVSNLAYCGPESLSQLDIETFLYAATIQAQRNINIQRNFANSYNSKKVRRPSILPYVNVAADLCTEEQINWWNCAFQVYKNLVVGNLADVRVTLQFGIEAVRGVNGPRIDLIIILKLGKLFVTRSQDLLKPLEKSCIEARAESLYKHGLNLLKLHNKGVLEPFRKLFKFSDPYSLHVEREVNILAEEAITYLASRYFRNEEYEECIEMFSGIPLPFATYFQAEAYRKLDDIQKTPKKTKKIYLDKAKDCLNQTQNLLERANIDLNHPLKSIIQSEIKQLQCCTHYKFTNDDYNDSLCEGCDKEPFLHETLKHSANKSPPKLIELENLVKQMVSTLTFVKEELVDAIKPEMVNIRKEITDLRGKIDVIEENIRKKNSPPSRDEDANVLDDLFIDEELQNQIYNNQQNQYANYAHQQTTSHQQSHRMHTPNALLNQPPPPHHQQPPPPVNPYNNPMYNPSYSMNYFPQYVMPGAHPSTLQGTQRASLGLNQSVPFVDHALNFSITGQTQAQQILSQYGLLTQPTSSQDKMAATQTSVSSSNAWGRLYNNVLVEKGPPVNVVITSSDPLPSSTANLSQPTLSVTIPPQHIKPSVISSEGTLPNQHNTNFPILPSNLASSAVNNSALSQTLSDVSIKSKSEQTSKSQENVVFNKAADSININANNKGSCNEFDPRCDPKPDVLQKETETRTGEEDEEVLFCSWAKLFRHVDKEWKELGIGDIKLVKNKKDGKTKIWMKRDQTHEICADHVITGDMNLTQSKNEEKSFIWVANGLVDGESKTERFCVRFRHVEKAKEFLNIFMKVREEAKQLGKAISNTNKDKEENQNMKGITQVSLSKLNTFNFTKPNIALPKSESAVTSVTVSPFTSNPLFSTPTATSKDVKTSTAESMSPFSNFTFSKSTPVTDLSKPFSNLFNSLNSTQPNIVTNTSVNVDTFKTEKKDEVHNKSTSDAEDDYIPTAQFKPLIPLPDLVELQTGEENEKIIFEHRAKLLRFDKETKEWKERGIGNMKILVNINDPSKVRLVMRRELVHKLCCNQRLTREMKFKKAPNTESALSWYGQDFSENELHAELLTIRFKTAEICKKFHDTILEAQANMKEEDKEKEIEEIDNKEKRDLPSKGFGDKFKPKPGSWNCTDCYLLNSAEAVKCAACSNPKVKGDSDKSADKGSNKIDNNISSGTGNNSSQPTFTFGFPKSISQMENKGNSTVNTTKEISFGFPNTNTSAVDLSKPPTTTSSFIFGTNDATKLTFSFGILSTQTSDELKQQPNIFSITTSSNQVVNSNAETTQVLPSFEFGSKSASIFGVSNSSDSTKTIAATAPFIVAPAAKEENKGTEKQAENIFKLEKKEFQFTLKPKSPGKAKSPAKNTQGGDEESDSEVVEEENNTYFIPAIPLPDKVEIKTGEENEEVLYKHRAKLFRYIESEWKERGLGDVKILRHKETKKLRVVMRREQVLKICLNHALNLDIEYKRKDDKSWHFIVNDYSEGAIETMHFCLRFKNKDIAEGFMDAIKTALSNDVKATSTESDPSKETQQYKEISEEDKKRAEKLQLPHSFYENKNKANCDGCRGCDPDKFVFPNCKGTSESDHGKDPLPLIIPLPAKKTDSILKESLFSNSTYSPANTESVFKTSEGEIKMTLNKCVFGGSVNTSSSTVAINTNTKIDFNEGLTPKAKDDCNLFNSDKVSLKKEVLRDSTKFEATRIMTNDSPGTAPLGTLKEFKSVEPTELSKGENSSEKEQKTQKDSGSFSAPMAVNTTEAKLEFSAPLGLSQLATMLPKTFANEKPTEKSTKDSGFKFQIHFPNIEKQLGDNCKPVDIPQDPSNMFRNALQISYNTPTDLTSHKSSNNRGDSIAADDIPLNTENSLSFASLAKVGNRVSIFETKNANEYVGLTNMDAFKSFLNPAGDNNKNENSSKSVNHNASEKDDPNYDPHYDPVIALPAEVAVRTGEEEEKKIFGERATLYRYDNTAKEWKERGVGELKILYHPEKKTYRLVMRRDQVYKLVLNHCIYDNFEIKPLNKSGKAFCWATMNYVEREPQRESLAVRFKDTEVARKFETKIMKCKECLQNPAGLEPEED